MFKVYEVVSQETLRALGFRPPEARVRPKQRRRRKNPKSIGKADHK